MLDRISSQTQHVAALLQSQQCTHNSTVPSTKNIIVESPALVSNTAKEGEIPISCQGSILTKRRERKPVHALKESEADEKEVQKIPIETQKFHSNTNKSLENVPPIASSQALEWKEFDDSDLGWTELDQQVTSKSQLTSLIPNSY